MITMLSTTKKPPDVDWWFKKEPEKSISLIKFIEEFDGILDMTTRVISDNVRSTTIVFRDYESLGRYIVQHTLHPSTISRKVYNTEEGITTTTSFTIAD